MAFWLRHRMSSHCATTWLGSSFMNSGGCALCTASGCPALHLVFKVGEGDEGDGVLENNLWILVGLRLKDFLDQDWTMPIQIIQVQVTGTNHPQRWDIQTAVCSLLRTNRHWKTCTAPRCLSWWGKRDVFWLFSRLWESWECCEISRGSKKFVTSCHVKVTFSRPCPRHSTTMCGKSVLKRSFTQIMPNTLAWLKMCKCSTRHRGLVDWTWLNNLQQPHVLRLFMCHTCHHIYIEGFRLRNWNQKTSVRPWAETAWMSVHNSLTGCCLLSENSWGIGVLLLSFCSRVRKLLANLLLCCRWMQIFGMHPDSSSFKRTVLRELTALTSKPVRHIVEHDASWYHGMMTDDAFIHDPDSFMYIPGWAMFGTRSDWFLASPRESQAVPSSHFETWPWTPGPRRLLHVGTWENESWTLCAWDLL